MYTLFLSVREDGKQTIIKNGKKYRTIELLHTDPLWLWMEELYSNQSIHERSLLWHTNYLIEYQFVNEDTEERVFYSLYVVDDAVTLPLPKYFRCFAIGKGLTSVSPFLFFTRSLK